MTNEMTPNTEEAREALSAHREEKFTVEYMDVSRSEKREGAATWKGTAFCFSTTGLTRPPALYPRVDNDGCPVQNYVTGWCRVKDGGTENAG